MKNELITSIADYDRKELEKLALKESGYTRGEIDLRWEGAKLIITQKVDEKHIKELEEAEGNIEVDDICEFKVGDIVYIDNFNGNGNFSNVRKKMLKIHKRNESYVIENVETGLRNIRLEGQPFIWKKEWFKKC